MEECRSHRSEKRQFRTLAFSGAANLARSVAYGSIQYCRPDWQLCSAVGMRRLSVGWNSITSIPADLTCGLLAFAFEARKGKTSPDPDALSSSIRAARAGLKASGRPNQDDRVSPWEGLVRSLLTGGNLADIRSTDITFHPVGSHLIHNQFIGLLRSVNVEDNWLVHAAVPLFNLCVVNGHG
jgi:hypothetical protein